MHPICMICNKQTYHHYLDQLKAIKRWLLNKGVKKVDVRKLERELGFNYAFSHNVRCDYGIACHTINSINNEHHLLATEVKELLLSYLLEGSLKNVHDLLRLLQGYYPREYRVVSRYIKS